MFEVKKRGNYLKFSHPEIEEVFTVSGSNAKVNYPIVTFGSATNCVNAGWCPYSKNVREKGGKVPLCYAQHFEAYRTNLYNSREANFHFTMEVNRIGYTREFGRLLAKSIWEWREPRYIRFNESGDLDIINASVIEAMQVWFNHHQKKCTLYGYSKSKPVLRNLIREVGGVVMDSDVDFVVVNDREEAKELGLPVCPGTCGPCQRCMKQLKTAVVKH